MNQLEQRLRDAYRAAADTVPAGSLPELGRTAGQRGSRPAGRNRLVVPLAAAAAVLAIAVAAVIVVPQFLSGAAPPPAGHRHPTAAATAYPPYLIASTGTDLQVISAVTGAVTARLAAPVTNGQFTEVATGNGHVFVTAVTTVTKPCVSVRVSPATRARTRSTRKLKPADCRQTVPRPNPCAFRLYQFRVTAGGRPAGLMPISGELSGILEPGFAVSGDGQDVAYSATACSGREPTGPTYVAVRQLGTGQTRRWTIPQDEDLNTLSVAADGRTVAYNIALTKLYPSLAGILATRAAPGSLAARSHLAVTGRQFGRSTDIAEAVLAPDGGTLYFTTNDTGTVLNSHPLWQLRAYDVGTGRTSIVRSFADGLPDSLAVDPAGRFLLIGWETGSQWQTPHLARLNLATGSLSTLQPTGGPLAW